VAWDQRYRMLQEGETILPSDEHQLDDGGWSKTNCVGQPAPNPAYTSHRVYRRRKGPSDA